MPLEIPGSMGRSYLTKSGKRPKFVEEGTTLIDTSQKAARKFVYVDGEWKLVRGALGCYSAIAKKQETDVWAEDCYGKTIDEGEAGVDDTEVIKSALDVGGKIKLGEGTFKITQTLKPQSNTELLGFGIGKTILKKYADINLIEVGGRGENYVENIRIANLELDGNLSEYPAGTGLKIGYSRRITVENLYIHDNYFLQLACLNTPPEKSEEYLPTDITINNLYVNAYTTREYTEGILIGGRYVNASNIIIWNANKGQALHVYDSVFDRSHDINLSNIVIYNSVKGIGVTAPYAVNITNATLYNIEQWGLRIMPNKEASDYQGGLKPVHGVVVDNITIRNACTAVVAGTAAIVIRNAQRVKIRGRIHTCQLPGVRIDTEDVWGYTPDFDTQDIDLDLQIRNCGLQGAIEATKAGITLSMAHRDIVNVLIRGQILNNQKYSVALSRQVDTLYARKIKIEAIMDQGIYNEDYMVDRYENSGTATITGDGTTTTFTVDITHGLVKDTVVAKITLDRDGSVDKVYLVDTNSDGFKETLRVQVTFASAPANGEEVPIYWEARVVS